MSTPATPAALREMELQLKGIGDETIKYGKYRRKAELHDQARNSYQSDRPDEDGDWWKVSGARAKVPGTPTCTLPIIVARLMAYIPIAGRPKNSMSYPFKIIDEEGFLVKERLAVWIKKHMTLSNAEADGFSHLLVAAPKSTYAVPNYEDYIPVQVKENYDQFISEFINKHKEDNPTLHRNHISIFFSSLICGLDLFEPEQIAHHYAEVHGLEQGISDLGHQGIPAALEIRFICPSLLELEDMGETNRILILENIFHRCKASGIFFDTSLNDIKPHRAQDLISGIKEASNGLYFKRFMMFLGQAIRNQGQSISKISGGRWSFSCSWITMQEALISAIGDDRAVNRMLLISGLGFKDFSGQPLASLFDEVDRRVDEYMGTQEVVVHDTEMRPQCLYTYTLYLKYNIIIEITINLNEEFNAIRVCILREISLLYFNPMKLMSIPQFTKGLTSILERKDLAKDFTKKLVSLPKGAAKSAGLVGPTGALNTNDHLERKKEFRRELTSQNKDLSWRRSKVK